MKPNKRSKKGGFIVDGYLKDKNSDGKLLRIRKTFSGPNAKERAQAYLNHTMIMDTKFTDHPSYPSGISNLSIYDQEKLRVSKEPYAGK